MGVALVGFAVGLLLSTVTTGVAESATGWNPSVPGPVPLSVQAANLAGLWAGLLGAVVLASRIGGSGHPVRDFGLRVGAWWDVPAGVAVGLAGQYGLVRLIYLPFEHVDHGLARRLDQPAARDTGAVHSHPALAVALLLLAVGAPLVEEWYFRGLLLRSLLARLPVPAAVGLSGALFALAHFEALQFAGLAAFGVVLALLAWGTGRLAPSIAAHVAFNAAAVVTAVHLR